MNLYDVLSRVTVVGQCWEWDGATFRSGYASWTLDGKNHRAHRTIYGGLVGPIPDGLDLDHLCRNRKCVRPLHLDPVTRKVNTLRSPIAPAAINARKTQCNQGHEFTSANTYWYKGNRGCRICIAENCRKYRQRKAQAA